MKELELLKERHQEGLARYVKALRAESLATLERIEAKRDLNRLNHELKDAQDKIINEVESEVINNK
jgi:hypothetical protein